MDEELSLWVLPNIIILGDIAEINSFFTHLFFF